MYPIISLLVIKLTLGNNRFRALQIIKRYAKEWRPKNQMRNRCAPKPAGTPPPTQKPVHRVQLEMPRNGCFRHAASRAARTPVYRTAQGTTSPYDRYFSPHRRGSMPLLPRCVSHQCLAGRILPVWATRMRASSFSAGPSLRSCGTSSPRTAFARIACANLASCLRAYSTRATSRSVNTNRPSIRFTTSRYSGSGE